MKWKGSSGGTGEHLLRERARDRERERRKRNYPTRLNPGVHIKTPCGKQVRTGWVVVRGKRNDVRSVNTHWWMLSKATLMADGSGTDGSWFIRGSAVSLWEAVNLGFLYATRWNHALKSTYPQYTYRKVKPHVCSRIQCWSKYHAVILDFEMVKQQFREVSRRQQRFSRQTSDTLSPLLVASSIPGHPPHTHKHTPSVTFDCCGVSTKNKLTQLLSVTLAAPLWSQYLSKFWPGWSHRTAGMNIASVGASADSIHSIQEFLQHLCCHLISPKRQQKWQLKAANLLGCPTAK